MLTQDPVIQLRKGMHMADSLEKQVEQHLRAGNNKKTILKKLDNGRNHARLLNILNNKSLLKRRHKYLWINVALAIALLLVTLNRLLAISHAGHFDFYLLADFIVPTINFYVLREILLFQRNGYIFLAVLTGLGLLYPENRTMPLLFVNIGMICLAGFLYVKLFPKSEILGKQSKS